MRAWLSRLSGPQAATLAYVALVSATLALSVVAWLVAERSGLGVDWTPDNAWVFLLRNTAISAIVSAVVLRYFYVQHQWKENVRREAAARIEALQARIRPHFLFNSLNTVAALIAIKPEHAERAVEDLSDLFRASLTDDPDGVSLADEIALAERYLHLEALRLGDRLVVEWDVESGSLDQVRVPRLIIQPLVENAVYHGIETRPDGGRVEVVVRDRGGWVEVVIRNPLPEDVDRKSTREGHQMALNNVSQRLSLSLGHEARLETERSDGAFITRLRLPKLQE
nr:sensor histidine kinase [Natronospira proteinivora]